MSNTEALHLAAELRRHARKIAHPAGDTPHVMARAADAMEAMALRPEQPVCNEGLDAERMRLALSDVLAYVRGKDDIYSNGAIRQIAEDGLGAA